MTARPHDPIHTFPLQTPLHWVMGVLDGVHVGHQALLAHAKRLAKQDGGKVIVFTFDNHPATLFGTRQAPVLIIPSQAEKHRRLTHFGADGIMSIPFTHDFAQQTPAEFFMALSMLGNTASITVGDDWTFGKDRAGTVATLHSLEKQRTNRICITGVEGVTLHGARVSSTRIRQELQQGNLPLANELLGAIPYPICGTVLHGRQLATQMGFPTANILPTGTPLPPYGVYAIHTIIDDRLHHGIANLGVRPTVEDTSSQPQVLLETHLFDFQSDLYGKQITVLLDRFIRPEITFPTLDALKTQIEQDVATALADNKTP